MSFQHVTLVSYVNFINKHEYRTLTVLCIAIGGYRATPPSMDFRPPPPIPSFDPKFLIFPRFFKILVPHSKFHDFLAEDGSKYIPKKRHLHSKCGQKRIFERAYNFFAKVIKKSHFLLKNSNKCNLQK